MHKVRKPEKKITGKMKERIKINSKAHSPKSPSSKIEHSPHHGTRKKSLTIEIPTVETAIEKVCVESESMRQYCTSARPIDKIYNQKCKFCYTPYLIFALRIYEQVLIEDATTYEHKCFIVRRRIQLDGTKLDKKILDQHIKSVCETLKISIDDIRPYGICCLYNTKKMPLTNTEIDIQKQLQFINTNMGTIVEPIFNADKESTAFLNRITETCSPSYDFLTNIGDNSKKKKLHDDYNELYENGRTVKLYLKKSADNIACQMSTVVRKESAATETDDFYEIPQKDERSVKSGPGERIKEESIGDFIDYSNSHIYRSKHEIVDMLLNKNQKKVYEMNESIQEILKKILINEKDIPVKESSSGLLLVDSKENEPNASSDTISSNLSENETKLELISNNLGILEVSSDIDSSIDIKKNEDFDLEIVSIRNKKFVSEEDVKEIETPFKQFPINDQIHSNTYLDEARSKHSCKTVSSAGDDTLKKAALKIKSNYVETGDEHLKKEKEPQIESSAIEETTKQDRDIPKKGIRKVSIQDDEINPNNPINDSLKDLKGINSLEYYSRQMESFINVTNDLEQQKKSSWKITKQKDDFYSDMNKKNLVSPRRSAESQKSLEQTPNSETKKRVSIAPFIKSNNDFFQDDNNQGIREEPSSLAITPSMEERIDKNRSELAKFRYHYKDKHTQKITDGIETEPSFLHKSSSLTYQEREDESEVKEGCCSWAKKIKNRAQRKNIIKSNASDRHDD